LGEVQTAFIPGRLSTGRWRWSTTLEVDPAKGFFPEPVYSFDKPGTYQLQVWGRSQYLYMDRIIFFKNDTVTFEYAKDLARPESKRVGGAAPVPLPAPVPKPVSAPAAVPVNVPVPVAVPVNVPVPVAAPVNVPVPVAAPVKAPVPVAVPVKAPVPVAVPVKAPVPVAVPVNVPVPSAVPVKAPVPVAVPVKAPVPSAVPVKAPVPSAVPVKAPVPVAVPVKAPVPVAVPVKAPVPSAVPVNVPVPVAVPVNVPAPSAPVAVGTGTANVTAFIMVDVNGKELHRFVRGIDSDFTAKRDTIKFSDLGTNQVTIKIETVGQINNVKFNFNSKIYRTNVVPYAMQGSTNDGKTFTAVPFLSTPGPSKSIQATLFGPGNVVLSSTKLRFIMV
jgi:hypothetical protein